MFDRMEFQERLEKLGITLEKALGDINIICQYPQYISQVVYETDENKRVFERGDKKFITLTIEFDDPKGEIKLHRKNIIESYETELLKELEELKKEKNKYE